MKALDVKVLESRRSRLSHRSQVKDVAGTQIVKKIPSYCDRTAYQLADLAGLSYHNADEIAQKTHSMGFSKYHFFSQGNTQAFLIGNDQQIILTFRGSEVNSLGDWLTNSHCSHVRACGGRVHEGFWRDLQSVWSAVETQLQQFRDQQQTFLLTGHSLGGALAVLAGIQFQMCGYGIDGIYSFGTPRVGDRNFALQFNRRLYRQTFRLVNHKDVVPQLPPRELGYAHVGQLVYFDTEGKLCAYPGQDDSFAFKEALSDHDIGSYQRCIQANPIGQG
jgi:triacylglycerol lipase